MTKITHYKKKSLYQNDADGFGGVFVVEATEHREIEKEKEEEKRAHTGIDFHHSKKKPFARN